MASDIIDTSIDHVFKLHTLVPQIPTLSREEREYLSALSYELPSKLFKSGISVG